MSRRAAPLKLPGVAICKPHLLILFASANRLDAGQTYVSRALLRPDTYVAGVMCVCTIGVLPNCVVFETTLMVAPAFMTPFSVGVCSPAVLQQGAVCIEKPFDASSILEKTFDEINARESLLSDNPPPDAASVAQSDISAAQDSTPCSAAVSATLPECFARNPLASPHAIGLAMGTLVYSGGAPHVSMPKRASMVSAASVGVLYDADRARLMFFYDDVPEEFGAVPLFADPDEKTCETTAVFENIAPPVMPFVHTTTVQVGSLGRFLLQPVECIPAAVLAAYGCAASSPFIPRSLPVLNFVCRKVGWLFCLVGFFFRCSLLRCVCGS